MRIEGIAEIRVYLLQIDDSRPITVWLPVAIAQPAEEEARARGLTIEQFLIELIEKSLWLRGGS
jgi:hypothetical protein